MKEHLLVNLNELQHQVRAFVSNPYLQYMVVNPHYLTNEANQYLYYYRRWGQIRLDHTKMVDGVMLYYYKKEEK